MGLGAIVGHRLGPGITLRQDPRASEERLYHLAAELDRPDTTLAWLDCSDPLIDAAIDNLDHVPGTRLVVAIVGQEREQRRQLNLRAYSLRSSHASREYVDVPPPFTNPAQWIAYLRQLPKTRPQDLHIRFTLSGEDIDVHEGEQTFHKPWHLFVANVYRWGIPGECSKLAVAREHDMLTGPMVVESTKLIASGHIDISR